MLGVLWQLRLRRSVINSLWVCRPANQKSWLAFYELFCKIFVGETPTLPLSFIFNTHRSIGNTNDCSSNSFWVHGSEHYEEYWFVLLEDMIRKYDWETSYRGYQDYQDTYLWFLLRPQSWLLTQDCRMWIQQWWICFTARTEFWRNLLNFKYLVHIRISQIEKCQFMEDISGGQT